MRIAVLVGAIGIVVAHVVLVHDIRIIGRAQQIILVVIIVIVADACQIVHLREAAGVAVVGIEGIGKVELLLIVEGHIDKLHIRLVQVHGGHKAQLVKSAVSEIVTLVVGAVFRPKQAGSQRDIRLAEETDGGRIVSDGRDVGTEGTHSTAHRDVARGADDIGRATDLCILVYVLGAGRCSQEESAQGKIFFHVRSSLEFAIYIP